MWIIASCSTRLFTFGPHNLAKFQLEPLMSGIGPRMMASTVPGMRQLCPVV